MRFVFYRAFLIVLGVAALATPMAVPAASLPNSVDRARIAQLVYQSASARQADQRRGDAVTRQLRVEADGAQKIAAATRVELVSARTQGAKAHKRALELESKLTEQEQALSEAAEKYTAELARRDQDYARERTILISTGQRLLKTPEGGRILDLYNAGGEKNWKEARKIMDEARRVRRSLDARDAAMLYMQARNKGLETTPAVIAIFEEVVRDDPSNREDWYFLSTLYREQGETRKALSAAEKAAALASDKYSSFKTTVQLGRARSAANDSLGALLAFRKAVADARQNYGARKHWPDVMLVPEALGMLGSELRNQGKFKEAKDAFEEAVRLFEQILPNTRIWPVYEPYIYVLTGLGSVLSDQGEEERALALYEKSYLLSQEALSKKPGLTAAREALAATSISIGDAMFNRGKIQQAIDKYFSAQKIYDGLVAEDPDLRWYDAGLQYLANVTGRSLLALDKPGDALPHLSRAVTISRKLSFKVDLHQNLAAEAMALVALGRSKEAENRWAEALEVGNNLIALRLSDWDESTAVTQAEILLRWAEQSLADRDLSRAAALRSKAEPLILRIRVERPLDFQILNLRMVKLQAGLDSPGHRASASIKIYDDAFAASDPVSRQYPGNVSLGFARADFALAAAKHLLELGQRPAALERLQLAQRLFGDLAKVSDRTDIQTGYAEASRLATAKTSKPM